MKTKEKKANPVYLEQLNKKIKELEEFDIRLDRMTKNKEIDFNRYMELSRERSFMLEKIEGLKTRAYGMVPKKYDSEYYIGSVYNE